MPIIWRDPIVGIPLNKHYDQNIDDKHEYIIIEYIEFHII